MSLWSFVVCQWLMGGYLATSPPTPYPHTFTTLPHPSISPGDTRRILLSMYKATAWAEVLAQSLQGRSFHPAFLPLPLPSIRSYSNRWIVQKTLSLNQHCLLHLSPLKLHLQVMKTMLTTASSLFNIFCSLFQTSQLIQEVVLLA